MMRFFHLSLLVLILLAACAKANPPAENNRVPSVSTTSTGEPAAPGTAAPNAILTAKILFPNPENSIKSRQRTRFIVEVQDERGAPVTDVPVSLRLQSPNGETADVVPLEAGAGDVYRSAYWEAPSGSRPGIWSMEVEIPGKSTLGNGTGSFQLQPSTEDLLLEKYGFYLDPPHLKGIHSQVMDERGDARNGTVTWAGFIPQVHMMTENWVTIDWRTGDFNLDHPAAVKEFIRTQLGDFGSSPLRAFGPFERFQFQNWAAWRAKCRGEFKEDDTEMVIFYAPEVNKTFIILTVAVLPPPDIDPHAEMRNSFRIDPGIDAAGEAPRPLIRRLPAPELLAPELAAQFQGTGQPITLRWAPLKELADDEYYEVAIDFWLEETNEKFRYSTREPELVVPVELYSTPNCHVFNWQVRLMRQTGLRSDGEPAGEALSYKSLYRYFWWQVPPGEESPFPAQYCPYTHLD